MMPGPPGIVHVVADLDGFWAGFLFRSGLPIAIPSSLVGRTDWPEWLRIRDLGIVTR